MFIHIFYFKKKFRISNGTFCYHDGNIKQLPIIKKIIFYLLLILFITLLFAADEKPGRFFEDQPDVTNDHQIYFNYVLVADSEDRELDINGKIEKILLELNDAMAKATAEHKKLVIL